MASSRFQICSLALTELGLRPIASFQDTSNIEAAAVCEQIWDDYARYLLSIHSWRFAMKKQQLGRLADSPLNEWEYAFQLPSDMLNLRVLYESDQVGVLPNKEYKIFGKQLYANVPGVYLDYQAYVEPENWPYWYVEFAVMALASKLAAILTDKQDLAAAKRQIAFGPPQDNLSGGLFGQARRIDSMRMPTEPITNFELVQARFG